MKEKAKSRLLRASGVFWFTTGQSGGLLVKANSITTTNKMDENFRDRSMFKNVNANAADSGSERDWIHGHPILVQARERR